MLQRRSGTGCPWTGMSSLLGLVFWISHSCLNFTASDLSPEVVEPCRWHFSRICSLLWCPWSIGVSSSRPSRLQQEKLISTSRDPKEVTGVSLMGSPSLQNHNQKVRSSLQRWQKLQVDAALECSVLWIAVRFSIGDFSVLVGFQKWGLLSLPPLFLK